MHDADPTSTPAGTSSEVRPLFRRQAIEHVTVRQYGTVILARSISRSILTAMFVGMAAALIAFFALFGTTRKAQSQGVLLPTTGIIRVMPGHGGVIKSQHVKEGQQVRAGDILFVLSAERSSATTGSAERTISKLLRNRLDSFGEELQHSSVQSRQRLNAALRRARELAREIDSIDDQLAIQAQRLVLANQAYQRYSDLLTSSYISEAQLQDKQAEVLEQRQRMVDLRRIKAASERELSDAQAEARDLHVQAQREMNTLQRSVSALEQDLTENEARREIVVRAPNDGMVTAITGDVGQTVSPASVMASVLPAGAELEAEIYAPSRSAGFVEPGMTVLLRYQAYPYQKFGQFNATVREVALTSVRPDELTMPGAALPHGAPTEPIYRIRLKLDRQTVLAYGKLMPLKSGMLVDASIVLEHRRLYEWVLEPLFSISGRI